MGTDPVAAQMSKSLAVGEILRRSLALTGRLVLPFAPLWVASSRPNILEALDGREHHLFLNLFFIARGGRADFLAAIGFVMTVLLAGAIATAASGAMDHERVDFAAAFGNALQRFAPLSAVYFLSLLMVLLGFFAFVVPSLIIASVLFVVLPICVLEETGVVAAFKRALMLTKGVRFRIICLVIVILFLNGVEGGYEDAVFRQFGAPIAFIFAVIGSGVLAVFCLVTMTVVYRDLLAGVESTDTSGLAR